MVNQSNGPAVVKWLNIFVQLVTGGHIWSPVVTLVTIKVKDLNNDSLYSIYYQFILVTAGHTWSQLVTLVTVKVRNLNNDGLDVYYGPYGH